MAATIYNISALGFVLILILSGMEVTAAFSDTEMGDWKYHTGLIIKENSGKTLTNYQVLVDLKGADFPSNAISDGSDLRFKDTFGKELNYWIEEWDHEAKEAKIWVKVPHIPANGEAIIEMWYGNPSASAMSDGEAVFELFDDFESYTVGDIDGQDAWSRQTSYGFCEVSTTIAKEVKSLRVYDDTSSGYPWVTKNIQPHTSSFVIEFDYYPYAFSPYNLAGHQAGVKEDTRALSYAPFHIRWRHDLGLYYFNTGSQWTPVASNVFTKGVWNKITYKIIDFQNLDIYVANKYIGRVHEAGAATKVSYFTFCSTGTYPAGDEYYIDNIRVRQYTSSEPTVTFSAEHPISLILPASISTSAPTLVQAHIGEGVVTTFSPVWSSTNKGMILTGDINGDGILEVVSGSEERICAMDNNGNQLWDRNVATDSGISGAKVCSIDLADMDGDGTSEIIVGVSPKSTKSQMKILFFNGKGNLVKSITTVESSHLTVKCADLDNDGTREVIAAITIGYALKPRGVYVYDFTTGNERWHYNIGPSVRFGPIADINNDGNLEILLGSFAPHNGNSEQGTDDSHSYVFAFDKDGNNLWTKQIGWDIARSSVADLDGDGKVEIVCFRYQRSPWYPGPNDVYILDPANGNILDTYNGPSGKGWKEWAIADINGDGKKEIVAGNEDGKIRVLDHNLNLIDSCSLSGTVQAVNDINGDGKKEIIVCSDNKELVVLDNELNELWSYKLSANCDAIIVSDLLPGGANEIIVSADKLYVFSGSSDIPTLVEAQSDDGLVAEWHFDEGSGNILKDSSGNGNDGVIHGATWTTGVSGKALSFDGNDDYIEVPDDGSLDITDKITVEAWAKSNVAKNTWVAVKDSTGNYRYGIHTGPDGKIYFYVRLETVGYQAVMFPGPYSDNSWHHIVGTYDGRYLKIYVDGAYIDTTDAGGTYRILTNNQPLIIGYYSYTNQYFQGIIDEVRIYNRALTADKIKAHYDLTPSSSATLPPTSPHTQNPTSDQPIYLLLAAAAILIALIIVTSHKKKPPAPEATKPTTPPESHAAKKAAQRLAESDASSKLKRAKSMLDRAEQLETDGSQLKDLLTKAEHAYQKKDYTCTIDCVKKYLALIDQAEENKRQLEQMRNNALGILKFAKSSLQKAEELGVAVQHANELNIKAQSAFDAGDYSSAISYASQSNDTAVKSIDESKPSIEIGLPPKMQYNLWRHRDLTVTNTGTAHARDVTITFLTALEVRELEVIKKLDVGKQKTININMKPTEKGEVPVDYSIEFKDLMKRDYKIEDTFNLEISTDAEMSEDIADYKQEKLIPPSPTASTTQFTTFRTVWDPSNKDFVWDAGKPDEYGELPQIKEWIEGKNPNIYWFLLKIVNRANYTVNEWNVTLYTEQALTILEAHLDEKQVRIVESSFDTNKNKDKYVVSVPPGFGVSIPADGGTRLMYFKTDIRCEDALKMEFGVSGVVKLGTTPQIEVPIREKRFTYACKYGDFKKMFYGSIDALALQVMENLKDSYSREIVQNFTNSFRLIREFEKYCNDRYTESEVLIGKLEVVHSSLKAAEPITKEEILPLVEENLAALRRISGVEAQKERGIRMCEKLVELLHIATSKIR